MNGNKSFTGIAALLGAAALAGLSACAEKPTENPFPAMKPKVTITGMQISGGITRVYVTGTDEDGLITYYRYKFDSDAWIDSVEAPVYGKAIAYGSMDEQHTVKVLCVDDDGLQSDSAALQYTPNRVGTVNRPPDTEIFSPIAGAVTSGGVVVAWSGRDPDGSVTGYEVRFDNDATWTPVTATRYEKTGLAAGGHTVQVRSKDNFNVLDPTPATVSFSVQAGLAPDLSVSGNGATYFAPVGGSADVGVGWEAVADFYYGDISGYAYDFNGAGKTAFSTETEHMFTGLAVGNYTVDVFAKDIDGNEKKQTISFTIAPYNPTKEVLVVNGIDWVSYGGLLEVTYPAYLAGATPWDYWDLFATPDDGYPAGMSVNKLGNLAITANTIGEYKAILWHGNNFNGDIDYWDPGLMSAYIKAGGKLLLSTRRTVTYFNSELRGLAHVTGFEADLSGTFTSLKATAAGVAIGMQDVSLASNTSTGSINGVDGTGLAEAIFVNGSNPSVILGIRAKARAGDPWNFVVICGRQYRVTAGSANAMRDNYRKLLTDVFGVTVPALP